MNPVYTGIIVSAALAILAALTGWIVREIEKNRVATQAQFAEQNKTLIRIELQTTTTNGRMNAAEDRLDEHTSEIKDLREKVSKPANRRK